MLNFFIIIFNFINFSVESLRVIINFYVQSRDFELYRLEMFEENASFSRNHITLPVHVQKLQKVNLFRWTKYTSFHEIMNSDVSIFYINYHYIRTNLFSSYKHII
ncbi:hypothetical protein PUN28_000989 [Cardiocondyla obscurior]|uniref:Uncharacterized protein n=1 Tax=Cardiocondyla obscurior TaxID=286306 RepID=A0AAW2H2Z2_9HYME